MGLTQHENRGLYVSHVGRRGAEEGGRAWIGRGVRSALAATVVLGMDGG